MTPKPYIRFRLAGQIGAVVSFAALIVCGRAALAQAPGRPQTPAQEFRGPTFRAVSYDVYASLSPADQTLTAKATVEFESSRPSGTVECELHPNLRVTAVRDASGKMLEFDRDGGASLGVRVVLDNPLPAGQRVKLTFEYSGLLANEENSPVKGVRLAWIGKDGAYLLLPARWFPLTDYPSNRFTGVFRIEVPQSFVVVGTGTSVAPAPPAVSAPPPPPVPGSGTGSVPPVLRRRNSQGPAPTPAPSVTTAITAPDAPSAAPVPPPAAGASRLVYTFHVDRPEAAGTFVAGALQLNPVQAEGLNISVYAPPGSPAVQAHGEAVARIIGVFSDQFGPLSDPNLTLAQIPDATVASFAAPGLLLLSQRQWLTTPNTGLLSNLVASQWWGDQVMAATPSDAWLTVGMSRYAEALYLEQTAGKEGMNRALETAAVGALMYESAAPIAEAGNLEPFTPNYDSVVANKGSMVFHMLRGQLGDAAFFSLLRDFLMQYSGKAASIDDFEKMAEARADKLAPPPAPTGFVLRPDGASAPPASDASGSSSAGAINLRPFFAQWVHSTGVPEFTFNYTMYRTKSGFKLIGKLKQNLDFFRMPVEVEILTEGNPEYKIIPVSGMETSFDLDVFGRPKSNGILLDPHNYILKSSAPLRVRAVIAKGEALAEEGRYYDAIQQYNQALDIEKNNALAAFRTGEAFFYQRNYSAAANAFRDTLDGNFGLNDKWVEVWSHIYLGKIYDIAGDRPRAVNEYSKAQQTNDNTGGAQDEAQKYISKPYSDSPSAK
jgi:hypothetical protein